MQACKPSVGWLGVHDEKVRQQPTFAEWCDSIDAVDPGLGTRINEHPVFESPEHETSSTVWMPSSCDPQRRYGIVLSYRISKKNEEMTPTTSFLKPKLLKADVIDLGAKAYISVEASGILHLDPSTILGNLSSDLHPKK